MGKCANCGQTIAFGGVKEGDRQFCGKPCRDRAHLNAASAQLPHEFVLEKAHEVHASECPKCGGAGPVDLHTSYTVWSAGILTRWGHKSEVCCRTCGRNAKLKASAFSGLLGWWGFPWGFLMTPAQLIRNVGGIFSGHDPSRPSDQLVELVRKNLSARLLAEDRKRQMAENAAKQADGLPDNS